MKTKLLIHPTSKLLWLSDLHLDEAEPARKTRFLNRLTRGDYDAVVLTGDLSIGKFIAGHLAEISRATGERKIFFTTGNHDYFGSSFAKVDRVIADTCRLHLNLFPLGHGEIVELSRNTALVGHRGWYDGRAGFGANTYVNSRDYDRIEDFRGLTRDDFFKKLGYLGDESASYFRRVLPLALNSYQTVIVATHVPPFTQALRHGGNYCRMERQPYYSNRAAGNTLFGISRNFLDRKIIVWAGHSHSPATVEIGQNLKIRVAGAQPGSPAIQGITLID